MRTFKLYTLLALLLSANLLYGRSNCDRPDTLIRPDRNQLGTQLIQLRDSMDMTLKSIEKNLGKNAAIINQQLDKNFKDLKSHRQEVDKAIDKVAISDEEAWNVDIQNDLINTLNDKRNAYKRIKESVKQVFVARNFRS